MVRQKQGMGGSRNRAARAFGLIIIVVAATTIPMIEHIPEAEASGTNYSHRRRRLSWVTATPFTATFCSRFAAFRFRPPLWPFSNFALFP